MARFAEALATALLAAGACSLVAGEIALADSRDLGAVYWLALGASCLRAGAKLSPSRVRV